MGRKILLIFFQLLIFLILLIISYVRHCCRSPISESQMKPNNFGRQRYQSFLPDTFQMAWLLSILLPQRIQQMSMFQKLFGDFQQYLSEPKQILSSHSLNVEYHFICPFITLHTTLILTQSFKSC